MPVGNTPSKEMNGSLKGLNVGWKFPFGLEFIVLSKKERERERDGGAGWNAHHPTANSSGDVYVCIRSPETSHRRQTCYTHLPYRPRDLFHARPSTHSAAITGCRGTHV